MQRLSLYLRTIFLASCAALIFGAGAFSFPSTTFATHPSEDQNHCWCRKSDNACEHHVHLADGRGIECGASGETSCTAYCTSRGWTSAFCDTSWIDRTEEGNGTCPRNPPSSSGDTETPGDGETERPAESVQLYNPLGSDVTIASFIGRGIRAVIGIVGAIALLMFIYGGIMWMVSGGSQERVASAKNILKNATIGLLLIFFSYTIISVFFDILSA